MSAKGERFDVIIVGGGLVGASAACALSGHGLSVAVIEAVARKAASQPSYDDRTLALSVPSCRILHKIGLWPGLGQGVTAIKQVQVSHLGHWGRVALRAEEFAVAALGYVVEARLLGAAVHAHLPKCADITFVCPANVTAIKAGAEQLVVTAQSAGESRQFSAKLLISAEGSQSLLRDTLALEYRHHDYRQRAVIANLTPELSHRNRAFERLTATGPIAVLPHTGDRCGLVWCVDESQGEEVMGLDDDAFLARVQQRFGYRLGRLKAVGKRSCYPLRLVHVPDPIGPRSVLIGNAAHTIHPIAAQGFNLGLRDVATLADVVLGAHAEGVDIGGSGLLRTYQDRRQKDQQATVAFTDGLVRGFAQPFAPVRALASLGLMALEVTPGLKQRLLRRASGATADLPSWVRGEAVLP